MKKDEPRLTVTVEPKIYEGLLDVTDRRHPRLTKRYVIELALTRLFEDVNRGQLQLGLEVQSGRRN
ncbi:hypothetical protein NKI66_20645 [Mesorhizobium sp. M0518]|uniref:hypothetical protein n=1 Tax=Mesorhizobium TaxID=68287 RepID=UPI0003CF18A6|nr:MULTISPECIES: hypothetical protein [Mesorhizobium]ESY65970.1 hypothetical protein X742_20720 [Mesorhizobium sp. LNHC232B00]ESY91598.1 hypothetical protein X738_28445 [Mesorhizobium sp. LNHC209A00]WJI38281.1 hypothetical protein NL534_31230 [Mesorhizobium opportunistum]